MKNRLAFAIAFLAGTTALFAAERYTWSAANGFPGLGNAVALTVDKSDDGVSLAITGGDSKLYLAPEREFLTAGINSLSIRYRAEGTGRAGGQFYWSRGSEGFSDARRWKLPPMVADGAWHTLKLDLAAVDGKADWFRREPITSFRFDPTDSSGGKVVVSEIVFGHEAGNDSKAEDEVFDRDAFRSRYDADKWPEVASEIMRPQPMPAIKPVEVRSVSAEVGSTVIRAGEKMKLAFTFAGGRPALPVKAEVVFKANGYCRWVETVTLTPDNFRAIDETRYRINLQFAAPLYLSSCRLTAVLRSPGFYDVAEKEAGAEFDFVGLERVPGFEKKVTAGVKMVAGAPRFTVNGRPFYALWGTKWPHTIDLKHSDAPLNVVTVWTRSRNYWPKEGVFDPGEFDLLAEANRRTNKDAWFMWDLTMYPPQDWAKNHPEEMARDEQGRINTDGGDKEINYSFASRRAMKDIAETMEKAIRYLESSPYANRIIGYRINSGHTAEWLGWDPTDRKSTLDFSQPAAEGFAEYLQARHPEIADRSVPTRSERSALDDGAVVWDVTKHLRAAAYHRYYNDVVADDVIGMLRRAKELVGGEKLVGTYFGYVMTLFGSGDNQMRAHFSTEKVLESGAADFLMSPQPYEVRVPGDIRGDMKPFKTIQNHGIVSVVEDDTRTFHAPRIVPHQLPTEWLTTEIMRRNMSETLCRNEPFYTYAICTGTEFDYPQFAADCAIVRKVGEWCLKKAVERKARIAVVVSEESIKASPFLTGQRDTYERGYQFYKDDASGAVVSGETYGGTTLGSDPYIHAYTRFARIGAPVDYLLAEDLARDVGDYQLYIFNCATFADDRLIEAARKLQARDCTVLWTYAPGYATEDGTSVENMRRLTGITFEEIEGGAELGGIGRKVKPAFSPIDADYVWGRYADGKPALAAKRVGKMLSVFSSTYRMEVPVMAKIAKAAKVHRYSDSMDPVDANDSLLMLHARFEGEKKIRLPRKTTVIDVFKRRLVGRNLDSFSYYAPLHSTALFYFGDDAEQLLKELGK